jgi:hypothetical protein
MSDKGADGLPEVETDTQLPLRNAAVNHPKLCSEDQRVGTVGTGNRTTSVPFGVTDGFRSPGNGTNTATADVVSTGDIRGAIPNFMSPASTFFDSRKYVELANDSSRSFLYHPSTVFVGSSDRNDVEVVSDPLFDREHRLAQASSPTASELEQAVDHSGANRRVPAEPSISLNNPFELQPSKEGTFCVEHQLDSFELMESLIADAQSSPFSFSMPIPSQSTPRVARGSDTSALAKEGNLLTFPSGSSQQPVQSDIVLGDHLRDSHESNSSHANRCIAKNSGRSRLETSAIGTGISRAQAFPETMIGKTDSDNRPNGRVPKTASKRKPRTYSRAIPSQHCHICSRRPTEESPHAACGNLNKGKCRKTICRKCFNQYKWDVEAAKFASVTGWVCPHCQGICPDRAQCHIYDRTSERRRNKTVNHRKSKCTSTAVLAGRADVIGRDHQGFTTVVQNSDFPLLLLQASNGMPQPPILSQAAFGTAGGASGASLLHQNASQALRNGEPVLKAAQPKTPKRSAKGKQKTKTGNKLGITLDAGSKSALDSTCNQSRQLSAEQLLIPVNKKGKAPAQRKRQTFLRQSLKKGVVSGALFQHGTNEEGASRAVQRPVPRQSVVSDFLADLESIPLSLDQDVGLLEPMKASDIPDLDEFITYGAQHTQDMFQFSLDEALNGHAPGT